MFVFAHLYEVVFTKPGPIGANIPDSERHSGEVRVVAINLQAAVDLCKMLYPKYEIRSISCAARVHGISTAAIRESM